MTSNSAGGRVIPERGTVGYIVGYDGSRPGAKPKARGWVVPADGMNAIPRIHETLEAAEGELGGQRVGTGLMGRDSMVLRVFHVRVRWNPLFEGHRGYYATTEDAALRDAYVAKWG